MEQQKKYDIFISYRKDDNLHQAQHIRTLLANEYPNLNISLDSHNLHGRWFPNLIERIDNCKKFIVLISENSLHYPFQDSILEKMYQDIAQYSSDKIVTKVSELKKNNVYIDYFRLEIARILCKQDVTIVPVLLAKGAKLFTLESLQLPKDIVELTDHQSISFIDNKINTEEFDVIIPSIKRLLYPNDVNTTNGTFVITKETQIGQMLADDFDLKKTIARENYIFHNGFCFSKGYENVVSVPKEDLQRAFANLPKGQFQYGDCIYERNKDELTVTLVKALTIKNSFDIESYIIQNDVRIPITSIAKGAFQNNTSLEFIKIYDGITTIECDAFSGCSFLKFINIPNSVTKISGWAFNGCSSLQSIIIEDGNQVYDSRNKCNAIIETATNTLIVGCKKTIIPKDVTAISSNAFSGCSTLKSLTIPDSVTNIGDCTFEGCSSLTEIIVPNSVTSIGWGAFSNCSSLRHVVIPNSVTSIGRRSFSGCTSLKSIVFGGTMRDWIHSYADCFLDCIRTESLNITNNIVDKKNSICFEKYVYCSDGNYYFKPILKKKRYVIDINNDKHTSNTQILSKNIDLNLRRSFAKLPNEPFEYEGCIYERKKDLSLVFKHVTHVESVIKINSFIEQDSIQIPITTIDDNAFKGDLKLEFIEICEGINKIGDEAFCGCNQLRDVIIPNTIKTIGRAAFSGCSSIVSINIPNSVVNIEEGAFSWCSSLSSLNLPNGITRIKKLTFAGCYSLESITIPESVKCIEKFAFLEKNSLKSIIFLGTKEQWREIKIDCHTKLFLSAANIHCTNGDIK